MPGRGVPGIWQPLACKPSPAAAARTKGTLPPSLPSCPPLPTPTPTNHPRSPSPHPSPLTLPPLNHLHSQSPPLHRAARVCSLPLAPPSPSSLPYHTNPTPVLPPLPVNLLSPGPLMVESLIRVVRVQ